jgi:transcriptional regulator with XRE-family HTH domain
MTTATTEHVTTGTPPAPIGWIPSDATFAARLALIRQGKGWNIKEAARICGQPAATWRLWEIGGALPRNETVTGKAIATASGCDYLWLVHGPGRGVTHGYRDAAADPLAARVVATAGEQRRRRSSHHRGPAVRLTRAPSTPVAA